MADMAVPSRTGNNHHPIFAIVLGIGMVFIFLWGLMLQIQTSEAMLLGQSSVVVSFSNWGILSQIPDMISNKYAFGTAMAVFLAWAIEFAYFTALIFHEKSKSVVGASGAVHVKCWDVGILLCVIYNMISDFNCGTLGSGFFGHLSFSLLMTFVEAFFGIIGVALIVKGWKSA